MSADIRTILTRAAGMPGGSSSDFDLNAGFALPENRLLKPAAVLVPVTKAGEVILTKRSSRLKHHPGQIAFPGGRRDEGDRDIVDTALRETEEEIGLGRDHIEVLGSLPIHETVTNYRITPVLALVDGSVPLVPETGEVAEIFRVPLAHVINPENFRVEARRWQGQKRHYYTAAFGPYYIWGATARILRGLADRVRP